MSDCLTAAFYRFVALPDFEALRAPLTAACERLEILGTILLSLEGINGTVAGAPDNVRQLFAELGADPRFSDLDIKESFAARPPFYRLKVRLKREIVTLGVPGVDPVTQAGEYVEPQDWNTLLDDPDVTVVDTRNDYEVAIGTFDGALDPATDRFGELPAWLDERDDIGPDTRVAMFCTGGIRCEKSTALLRARGVREVYHLRGGILNYLEKIPPKDNRFRGHCFVFDERVAVDADLKPGPYTLCRACRVPLSEADLLSDAYVEGVSCARCIDHTTDEQKARFAERQRQMTLAEQRREAHLGRKAPPPRVDCPVLYSFRRCPFAMRARLALLAVGLTVELREVALRDKPEAMLEASPKGTVPVLVTMEGRVVDESLAIMYWALEQADPLHWLAPDTNSMREWIARCDDDFKHHLDRYKYATRYADADPVDHRTQAAQFLIALEHQLAEHDFLFGDARALADVAIAPFVRQFRIADPDWFDAQAWPRLQQWLRRFSTWALFEQAMVKHTPWHDYEPQVLFP